MRLLTMRLIVRRCLRGKQLLSETAYNANGTVQKVTYGNGGKAAYTYDSFKRVTGVTYLSYIYDDCGNIIAVSDGVKQITYVYNKLGQLIRANDPHDTTAGSSGTTWVYAYDLGGNILSKKAYAYTTGTLGAAVHTDTYTYGDANWKDKLTAFNGKSITYDAIGNPLKDTWTYTWGKGRQLQYMVKSGDAVYFYYNEDGVRLQKTATGTTGVTERSLHGKNIVHPDQRQEQPALLL